MLAAGGRRDEVSECHVRDPLNVGDAARCPALAAAANTRMPGDREGVR
jgi:hypothetical protein